MEKHVESQILHWLNSKEWCFAWKNNTTGIFDPTTGNFRRTNNRFAISGVPDILGFFKGGLFLGIEVKGEKGKTSPAQEAFLWKAGKMDVICFVARSLEEVQIKLKEKNPLWT